MGRCSNTQLFIAFILLPWATLGTQFLGAQELELQPADLAPQVELLSLTGSTDTEGDAATAEPQEKSEPATAESAETLPPPRPVSEPIEASADEKTSDTNAATKSEATSEESKEVVELEGEPILRGPIHEAFADPVEHSPVASEVIETAPPSPVEEIPPTINDERKNMEWVPGYWAWEPHEKKYVWVSGVWRKTPKDRVWVAGQWEQVENGYRWVPGAWLPAADGEVVANKEILPMPPESLEEGPTSPAPSDGHFWVPGAWEQTDAGDYAWRPGYWSRSQENWVWVPDHYKWDPAGCVFVPGYWDYTWERRGTLYAPCTFSKLRVPTSASATARHASLTAINGC